MMHVPYDLTYGKSVPQVLLLAPYYREREVVAYAQARLPSVDSLGDFVTHKVGVMLATGADSWLMTAMGGRLQQTVRHYLRPSEAAVAMKAGEIDAIMGEAVGIESALEAERVEDRPEDTALATAAGAAMRELDGDSTIRRLFERRGLTYTPPELR